MRPAIACLLENFAYGTPQETMRVVLAQTDCVLGDTETNLSRAKEVVAQAKDRGTDLTSSLS